MSILDRLRMVGLFNWGVMMVVFAVLDAVLNVFAVFSWIGGQLDDYERWKKYHYEEEEYGLSRDYRPALKVELPPIELQSLKRTELPSIELQSIKDPALRPLPGWTLTDQGLRDTRSNEEQLEADRVEQIHRLEAWRREVQHTEIPALYSRLKQESRTRIYPR